MAVWKKNKKINYSLIMIFYGNISNSKLNDSIKNLKKRKLVIISENLLKS